MVDEETAARLEQTPREKLRQLLIASAEAHAEGSGDFAYLIGDMEQVLDAAIGSMDPETYKSFLARLSVEISFDLVDSSELTVTVFQPLPNVGEDQAIDRDGESHPSYAVWRDRATCAARFPGHEITATTLTAIEAAEVMDDDS